MDTLNSKKFTHLDHKLFLARMKLSDSKKIESLLKTRAVLVGMIRSRLREQYPHLNRKELNLKLLEEIERANKIQPRSFSI